MHKISFYNPKITILVNRGTASEYTKYEIKIYIHIFLICLFTCFFIFYYVYYNKKISLLFWTVFFHYFANRKIHTFTQFSGHTELSLLSLKKYIKMSLST